MSTQYVKVYRRKIPKTAYILNSNFKEQDKSSDIEQQPPFGDRKISNIQPQNRGGGLKTNRNII